MEASHVEIKQEYLPESFDCQNDEEKPVEQSNTQQINYIEFEICPTQVVKEEKEELIVPFTVDTINPSDPGSHVSPAATHPTTSSQHDVTVWIKEERLSPEPEERLSPLRDNTAAFLCAVDVKSEDKTNGNSSGSKNGEGGKKKPEYRCKNCRRSFPLVCSLNRHMEVCTITSENAHLECSVCGQLFQKTTLLHSHIRKHDNTKPFSCDECGMRFKSSSGLVQHQKRHTGLLPYACKVCGKKFPAVGPMETHLRIHTKEKPFSCKLCGWKFKNQNNLDRHMRRHENEPNLKCETCGAIFVKLSRLKYHMRLHWPDKKPFKCEICPKTYINKQNITRHYKKRHPDTVYNAPYTDALVCNAGWRAKIKNDDPEENMKSAIENEDSQSDSEESDDMGQEVGKLVVPDN